MSDKPPTPSQSELPLTYRSIPAQQATFKAGIAAPVHGWFRLTPSFGPDLVRDMLTAMDTAPQDVILDPFSGASTTLIECQQHGLTAYGFEINPLLHFVGQTSLNWALDPADLRRALADIAARYERLDRQTTPADLGTAPLHIPPIHQPFKWWRPDVLKRALIIKHAVQHGDIPAPVRDFFRLALAGVLVPDLSNVTLGRLQLHFIDRSADTIDVWAIFAAHAGRMINDVADLAAAGQRTTSTVFHTDATRPGVSLPHSITRVITSPPYPNRYSYVWNTRPHLYFFDFFDRPVQAANLDKRTIGGTWGTATSILAKGELTPDPPALGAIIGPTADAIRAADNLMANYVVKYFNLVAAQVQAMTPLLAPGARVAYVVGCSRIKGVYVETDTLLGRVFEVLGYRVDGIERFRRRNSGKNLFESIVYAYKP